MLRDEVSSDAHIAELRKLVSSKSNHVAGAAAEVLGDWDAHDAGPDLAAAFDRFMNDPVKTDPGCAAKRPIVEALIELQYADADLYLRAARHVQQEPMWGKPEDTAPAVRGLGGRGLVTMQAPDAMHVIAELIMDREIEARRLTVDTLTQLGTNEAALLLRCGALAVPHRENINPMHPQETIVGECLYGLMQIAADESLEFVARFLCGDADTLLSAALAIGESRHPDAFRILEAQWKRTLLQRERLLLPIALTRSDDAFQFLGHVLVNEDEWKEALNALTLFAADDQRNAQIRAWAEATGESTIIKRTAHILAEA